MRTESASILVKNILGLLQQVKFDDPARRKKLAMPLHGIMTGFDEDFAGGFIDFQLVNQLQVLGAERLCYVALDFDGEMEIGPSSSLL
ncbi:hypothetical protein [Pseudomonas sp. SDO52101_S400]